MDLPIACTLDERSLAERRERWERLMDRSLVDRRPHERGMVLRFREDPGAAGELAGLVDLERDCCGFAEWTVDPPGGDGFVTLRVEADGAGAAAIREMFTPPA